MYHATASYDGLLVTLSFLVSVFGSYTGLQMVKGLRQSTGLAQYAWLVAAAVALGAGGIWTMHFIGMIAYHTQMEVGYDAFITFLSMLIAVTVAGIGIFILHKNQTSYLYVLIAGFITGLGIASMHYTGMEAMVVAADISYDPILFTLSVLIAIVASTTALWLAFNLNNPLPIAVASVVMGIAICGMHYTGMAAMIMTPNHDIISIESSIRPFTLGVYIFCFSMVTLVLSLAVTLNQLERRLSESVLRAH